MTAVGMFAASAFAGETCVPHWDATIGNPGPNGEVFAWALDGNDNVYAGGVFLSIGALATSNIARWNGAQWFSLSSGVGGQVSALAMFNSDLYAGGAFPVAGGDPAQRIARWDGAQWNDVGGGADNKVLALTNSSIGGPLRLYAGGLFDNIGGSPAQHIARWDGAGWSPLGAGVTTPGEPSAVYAITEFDLGDGPRLAVGGLFSIAGGQPASNIAIWDGAGWAPLGDGVDSAVHSLVVFDDGLGSALYAGGAFGSAGGIPAKRVARWDGSAWSAVGGNGSWGTGSTVHALTVYDDGQGQRLIAGGDFIRADDAIVQRLASWDGVQWSAAFGGADARVSAILVDQILSEDKLLIGGSFMQAGGLPAIAASVRVGCSVSSLTGDLNGDGSVDTADLGLLLANFGTTNPDADLNADGIVDTADLGLLLANFGV